MELTVTSHGDTARFSVAGAIDEQGAEDLKQRFRELDFSFLKEVVFDFGGVNHIGSAGIGKLLLFYKALAVQEGRIVIENISGTIYDLFMTLKLDAIFTLSRGRGRQ